MKTETIVYCVVALLLGMLLANMLNNVCGCKNIVEGKNSQSAALPSAAPAPVPAPATTTPVPAPATNQVRNHHHSQDDVAAVGADLVALAWDGLRR